MKNDPKEIHPSLVLLTAMEFLTSYNKNMPLSYPRASMALLMKFQEEHSSLFKHNDMWSLDMHRKKLFEWLPRSSER